MKNHLETLLVIAKMYKPSGIRSNSIQRGTREYTLAGSWDMTVSFIFSNYLSNIRVSY